MRGTAIKLLVHVKRREISACMIATHSLEAGCSTRQSGKRGEQGWCFGVTCPCSHADVIPGSFFPPRVALNEGSSQLLHDTNVKHEPYLCNTCAQRLPLPHLRFGCLRREGSEHQLACLRVLGQGSPRAEVLLALGVFGLVGDSLRNAQHRAGVAGVAVDSA